MLVVGARQAGLERLAPMLRRASFSVHSVDASSGLRDLVLSTGFELIIVAFPLPGMAVADLVGAIRSEGSACHGAGLLVLAEPGRAEEARALVDAGANRAVCGDWNESRIWRAVSDILDIAPRIAMRVQLHAEFQVPQLRGRSVFQTVNVSTSGALLQGREIMSPGAGFEFLFRLPGGGLVDGEAEVVRRSDPAREGVDGIGARFTELREPGRELLLAHLERQIAVGNRR